MSGLKYSNSNSEGGKFGNDGNDDDDEFSSSYPTEKRKDILRMLETTYYNSDDDDDVENQQVMTSENSDGTLLSPKYGLYPNLPLWRDDFVSKQKLENSGKKRNWFVCVLGATLLLLDHSTSFCFFVLFCFPILKTELPGFQHAINVTEYNSNFAEMLQEVILSKKSSNSRPNVGPWYYGHLYLPGGYENVDKPEYKLSIASTGNTPLTGTLMKISDFYKNPKTQTVEVVVVQALGRFFVDTSQVQRHGSPFGIASVEMLPDEELVEAHYLEAKQVIEQSSSGAAGDMDSARGAACVGAIEEGALWHEYEFQNVHWDKSATVAPVSNFNVYAGNSTKVQDGTTVKAVNTAMEDYLNQPDIFEGECSLGDDFFDDEEEDCVIDDETGEEICQVPETLLDTALRAEYEVWIELDKFARMAQKLPSEKVDPVYPLPPQILGLLPRQPTIQKWPKFFALSKFRRKMDKLKSLLGNEETKLQSVENYPEVRRCRRLSYIVWALLEKYDPRLDDNEFGNNSFGSQRRLLTKQDILEIDSTAERLQAAKSKLERINKLLLQNFD